MDVGRVWDCMLCICVSDEGWDGESVGSEALSLLSYTLRYVGLAFLGCPGRTGPFFFLSTLSVIEM
jgi:hypothetical protein